MPENFKAPYAATSPQDFWRRWHISLSTWLRDYLYIPLGGSRGGTRVLVVALMGTMLLGGLWHGASWNFVLWGAVHGLLLLIHRGLTKSTLIKSGFEKAPTIMLISGWVITQYLIFMTWLIFRVEDTAMLIRSLKTFIGFDSHWDLREGYEALPEMRLLPICLVGLFILIHGISGKIGGLKIWISRQNPILWGFICGTLISFTFLLRPAETVDFIYFRF